MTEKSSSANEFMKSVVDKLVEYCKYNTIDLECDCVDDFLDLDQESKIEIIKSGILDPLMNWSNMFHIEDDQKVCEMLSDKIDYQQLIAICIYESDLPEWKIGLMKPSENDIKQVHRYLKQVELKNNKQKIPKWICAKFSYVQINQT